MPFKFFVMISHLPVSNSIHASQKTKVADLLLQFCQDQKVIFCDKKFPNSNISLYQNPPHREYVASRANWNFTWNRPKEILGNYSLFINEPCPADIRQGQLGDCYLLCAISSLAEQPSLISRLFYFPQVNDHGVIGVWLFINGKWDLVMIDEYFPAMIAEGKKKFAFSYTIDKEVWVMAIEKAYAKAYGSFYDIVGGCPFWALRELSGAPYEVIHDFANSQQTWVKVRDAIASGFILACSSRSGTQVESLLKEGIATSHAYSMLDAREVKDSRGRPRRIVQIRNPWGKYEWNGEFSDKSTSWTPELKQLLKVEVKDDGLFWMPWTEFCKFYVEISILKVRPGFINNAVSIKRVDKMEKTIVRMSVNDEKSLVTLAIDQIDSRCIDREDYTYAYFRTTVARIHENNTLDFIAYSFSDERNVFVEDTFIRGHYLILLEVYWTTKYPQKYTFGTYSETQVELEVVTCDSGVYNSAEHMIWQSYAAKNRDKLKFIRNAPSYTRREKPSLEMRQFNDPQAGILLYAYYNKGEGGYAEKVNLEYDIRFTPEIVASVVLPGKAELQVNPGDVDIFLKKADRVTRGRPASFALTPGKQELVGKPFPVDTRTVELLRPSPKVFIPVPDASFMTLLNGGLTDKEVEEEKAVERGRKALIAKRQAKTLFNKEQMEAFSRTQISLLEDFAKMNSPDFAQHLQNLPHEKSHHGPNFFMISDSIRNMAMPEENKKYLGGRDETPKPSKRPSSVQTKYASERKSNWNTIYFHNRH